MESVLFLDPWIWLQFTDIRSSSKVLHLIWDSWLYPRFLNSWFIKVKKNWKDRVDFISSSSPSVKIQIMGGKVCLRHKGKTLLGVVNKLFVFKSLLTTLSNVFPLHFKQVFLPIFEFRPKVKVMGLNPGYLVKSSLLYALHSNSKSWVVFWFKKVYFKGKIYSCFTF